MRAGCWRRGHRGGGVHAGSGEGVKPASGDRAVFEQAHVELGEILPGAAH